jgi:Flp pilus assembly protein TadD
MDRTLESDSFVRSLKISGREAVELRPGDAESHYGLGLVLHKKGKLDEAAASYRATVDLMPDNAKARFNLALALAQQGDSKEAAAEFRAVISLKPDPLAGLC